MVFNVLTSNGIMLYLDVNLVQGDFDLGFGTTVVQTQTWFRGGF